MIVLSLSTARAERSRVAICSSGPADPQVLEIQTRLSAELASAGFDSVVVYTELEGREAIEGAARGAGTLAGIGITRGARPSATVWVADPQTGRALYRSVELDPDSEATAILAIRAVELLKVSRLELEETRSAPVETSPTTPAGSAGEAAVADAEVPKASPRAARTPESLPAHEPTKRPAAVLRPKEHRSMFGIYGGAALLTDSSSLPPSIAPAIGFMWRPAEVWGGMLQMWGPAMKRIEGTEGAADVDEEAVLAHVEFEPIHATWLHAFTRLGAGALRLGARGDATAPYRARSGQAWSAAGALGLGFRSAQLRPLMILVTADALLLVPRPGVEFAGRVAASRAHPTFVAQAGIGVEW